LATASDALRIWDSEGKLISEGKSDAYLWGISWKPNGKQLVTSSLKKEIDFWNQKAKRIKGVN
jgi:WD40 repeat protein